MGWQSRGSGVGEWGSVWWGRGEAERLRDRHLRETLHLGRRSCKVFRLLSSDQEARWPVRLLPRGPCPPPPPQFSPTFRQVSLERQAWNWIRFSFTPCGVSGCFRGPKGEAWRARHSRRSLLGSAPELSEWGLRPEGHCLRDPARLARYMPLALQGQRCQQSLGTQTYPASGQALAVIWLLKIGATEQLRAGKAGAPAVQHLSVHIKICKAETSPQPPLPLPLCLVRNWCQLFDCDNCYCLGKWLPGPMGQSLVCKQLGLHLPLGTSSTLPSFAHCSQRPAGLGLQWGNSSFPLPFPQREVGVRWSKACPLTPPTQPTSPHAGSRNRQACTTPRKSRISQHVIVTTAISSVSLSQLTLTKACEVGIITWCFREETRGVRSHT